MEIKLQNDAIILLPIKEIVTQKDIKWIFKIRCREKHVKMNQHGLYDSLNVKFVQKKLKPKNMNI